MRLLMSRIVLLVLATGLSACAPLEPWVKPYERQRLAAPLMLFSRDSLPDKHREHIHAVREGARGGNGAQGSGCGCN